MMNQAILLNFKALGKRKFVTVQNDSFQYNTPD